MSLGDIAQRQWDVLVVGAGPAGSIAARQIARAGRSVLLVDRAKFPRWKVCGCCLNGAALGALASVGLADLPQRLRAIPLTSIVLATNGRHAHITLPAGVSLSREAFDSALIDEAVRCGATFQQETTARRISESEIELECDSETCRLAPRVLVVADGLNGSLTSAVGKRPQIAEGSRIGAGVVLDEAPAAVPIGSITMAVAAGGYVGMVRLEDDRLDIAAAFDGAFVRAHGGLGSAAKQILACAGIAEIPKLQEAAWRGTPPLTRQARHIAGNRWFAIGDAAGYVEPFTGEGIAWALASGIAVAAIATREWSSADIIDWERTHRALVQSRQGLCRIVAKVLRSPLLCDWTVRALRLAPGLSGPITRRLNRGQLVRESVT